MRKSRCLIFSLLVLISVESEAALAPALYIFGDSIVDAGNNNFLNTKAKANSYPFGIDFSSGATGRFTNGRTMADFFAEWLGLKYQPPILPLKKTFSTDKIYEGFNYASGSSGILDKTGSIVGDNLCLRKQVNLFRRTVKQYQHLQYLKNSTTNLVNHLSKSIFMIYIGTNDYYFNFIKIVQTHDSTLPPDPEHLTHLLISKFKSHLEVLYHLGARKFVIFELPPLGCLPNVVKAHPEKKCVERFNNLAKTYNARLRHELDKLGSQLRGSTFVVAKTFDTIYELIKNSPQLGISYPTACCERTGIVCKDRNAYAFFNGVHPSEATNRIVASRCFYGNGSAVPFNVMELAKM